MSSISKNILNLTRSTSTAIQTSVAQTHIASILPNAHLEHNAHHQYQPTTSETLPVCMRNYRNTPHSIASIEQKSQPIYEQTQAVLEHGLGYCACLKTYTANDRLLLEYSLTLESARFENLHSIEISMDFLPQLIDHLKQCPQPSSQDLHWAYDAMNIKRTAVLEQSRKNQPVLTGQFQYKISTVSHGRSRYSQQHLDISQDQQLQMLAFNLSSQKKFVILELEKIQASLSNKHG